MFRIKISARAYLLCACMALPFCTLFGQENSKETKEKQEEAVIKNMVESKQFNFIAQTAIPTGGRSRQLTTEFGFRLNRDSLQSYLPFYGRAYEVPYNSSEGGINFTTTDFGYEVSADKKGGWDLVFTPKNQRSASKMVMYISSSGYASLQVTSNFRQMISFNGYITSLH